MSMKDNVDYIKQELSAQESLLENTIKAERVWKKYKNVIIGVAAVAIIGLVANGTMGYMGEKKAIEANNLFSKAIANDAQALSKLQAVDPKLYTIALVMNNKSQGSDLEFLKQLSLYVAAVNEKNIQKIGEVAQDPNFLNKDFALLNKAILEAKEGKYKEAKETLKMIATTSSVANLVSILEHFLLTK